MSNNTAGQLVTKIGELQQSRRSTPTLPLGIHFGLAEDRYRDDPGIGSTDIRRLTRNPSSYWFNSWMNPRREPDEPTPSQQRGTALHQLVFMGDDYFNRHYVCGPDQYGMSTGEKSASTRLANTNAAKEGKVCLKIDDYMRVAICGAMVTRNPELAGVFTGGQPEVSIFWMRDGVRCKARIDYLKVRGIGDLKSCANPFDLDFRQACRNDIGRYHYAEQASWYLDARAQIGRYVADGAVYGSDYDEDWLRSIATANEFGWQWVFYGMEGPPLTWSSVLSPGNPLLQNGRDANAFGLANYRKCLDKFGTDMWLLIEPPEELMAEDLPPWAR